MKKQTTKVKSKPKTKALNKAHVIKSVCDNYENGFFGTYGADNCVNCGERKAKHEQTVL
jgi:hypothetical protein